MNAVPQKETASFAESGLTTRCDVDFDLESLLLRPAAAEFLALSSSSQQATDVFDFVHQKNEFTSQQCVDALLADQHRRHSTEEAVPAETYCTFLRTRIGDGSARFEWQIVAQEFLLVLNDAESSSNVAFKKFCTRFPTFQGQLVDLSRSDGLSETLIIDAVCSSGSGHEPTIPEGPTQPRVLDEKPFDPATVQLDFGDSAQSSLACHSDPLVTINRRYWVARNLSRNCRQSFSRRLKNDSMNATFSRTSI